MGYRLYNTLDREYSLGAIVKRWSFRDTDPKHSVRQSSSKWKVFNDYEAIKKHLMTMMVKGVSTEHWVIQELYAVENNIPIQSLCDEKMLMKIMKKK